MFIRSILPLMAVFLFFIEPIFAIFSPIELFGRNSYLVPHFLFMYLLFLAVYYDYKKSLIYAIIFGVLYDVVYIDIIGLYSVLFPLFCAFISWIVKFIHKSLVVMTILTIVNVTLLEFIVYQFYKLVSITTVSMDDFLVTRLMPTLVANLLFLILLGWLFKYFIKTRKLQSI